MSNIKNGSRWSGGDGRVFVVIGTMIVEGKDWVYYRLEKPVDHMPAEFSCFEESFLSRFRPLPE
jgi:hypothetical protein